jgi:CBS domain-containing protein
MKAAKALQGAARPVLPRHRTVADVMTTHVHVAGPLAPFKFLVRLIEENRVSAIPIVDHKGMPVGIVSEADLLLKERRRQPAKAEGTLASDLMTSPPITVPTGTSLGEAARLMQEKNVRRLVVIDSRGRIAGIVSRSDLLQVFLRSDDDLRDEIADTLIPALFASPPEGIGIEVHSNVVTLSGQVDRKSDADRLGRLIGELDGVVEVVNKLSYRWDETQRSARADGLR